MVNSVQRIMEAGLQILIIIAKNFKIDIVQWILNVLIALIIIIISMSAFIINALQKMTFRISLFTKLRMMPQTFVNKYALL